MSKWLCDGFVLDEEGEDGEEEGGGGLVEWEGRAGGEGWVEGGYEWEHCCELVLCVVIGMRK